MTKMERAVVTVLGKDQSGIIYHVSRVLYEYRVNIIDLSQTVLGEMFNMVMIVELPGEDFSFDQLSQALSALGQDIEKQIRIQRMDIFDAMHRI